MMAMETSSVPSVLYPLLLRSGWRYRSLRRHPFSSEEKIWICKNIVDSCNDIDTDLAKDIKSFSLRYDIPSMGIVHWINECVNGGVFSTLALSLD